MATPPPTPSEPQQSDLSEAGADPEPLARSLDDVFALQVLQSLGGRFLPWSTGAMHPSGLLLVLNEIVLGSRTRIVECGTGLSTIFIARLLAQRGGSVISLEHDPDWATFVERELAAEDLGEHARIVRAPLEPHPLAVAGNDWYQVEAAAIAAESQGPIDLLIVDGPPADGRAVELARYPALPAFLDALAPDAIVILDDASRAGESRVLERWAQEAEIGVERRGDLGWVALAAPRGRSRP